MARHFLRVSSVTVVQSGETPFDIAPRRPVSGPKRLQDSASVFERKPPDKIPGSSEEKGARKGRQEPKSGLVELESLTFRHQENWRAAGGNVHGVGQRLFAAF